MSRQYYPTTTIDYHRRPNRSTPINIPLSAREAPRPYMMGSRTMHTSPTRESDSERNHPRRRIAVACSRCRKRKIKCSGDPGNGQGCLNCKNAGGEPGSCQFLRVNSRTYDCALPVEQWPYQVDGLASAPSLLNQISNPIGQFPTNSYSMHSLCSSSYSGASSYPGTSSLGRGQFSSNTSGLPYQMMPTRPDYSANYTSGLDGTYDTYGIQSGSYVLPAQETPASSTLYSNTENLRQWSSVGHSNRANFGFEHDLPPKYVSSNTPYGEAVLPSGPGSTDTSSLFPALGSIASALPLPNPLRNSDRVLPSPRAGLGISSLENLIGPNHGLVGEPASFLSQHTSAKPSAQWPPSRTTTGRSQTPTSTTSSSASAYSITATDGRPSSSTQEASQTAFGYIEHTPPTGSTTPSTECNAANNNPKPNVSAGTMQSHLLASSTYESGMLSEPLLRRDFSSPNLYTYTTGSGSKDDSQSSFSDGTLLNGQPYTRLRQPQSQPQQVKAYDARRRESSETGSRLSHRTSVASVGSSNREKIS